GAAVLLEGELDIRRGDRRAIMELDARAELEGGRLVIRGDLVGLGQARSKGLTWQVLDQGIVQGVGEVVGRNLGRILLRIEPGRRDGGVPSVDDTSLWLAAGDTRRGGCGLCSSRSWRGGWDRLLALQRYLGGRCG